MTTMTRSPIPKTAPSLVTMDNNSGGNRGLSSTTELPEYAESDTVEALLKVCMPIHPDLPWRASFRKTADVLRVRMSIVLRLLEWRALTSRPTAPPRPPKNTSTRQAMLTSFDEELADLTAALASAQVRPHHACLQ